MAASINAPEEVKNILGASIFWLYILAALYFTFSTITTIWIHATTNISSPPAQRRSIIFAFLTLASFTNLSYYMLNVLIQSYTQWSKQRHIRVPDCLVGTGCLLGSGREKLYLWEWSTTSTLFQDFGEALVADPGRWAWSNAALTLTFINVLFICLKGRELEIPKLYNYVILAEILPVSFAQNLFFLALSTTPRPNSYGPVKSDSLFFVKTGYVACLLVAKYSGPWLIQIILVARVLLALPLFVGTRQGSGPGAKLANADTLSLVDGAIALFLGLWPALAALKYSSVSELMGAVNSHPAVGALGYDFILSCISWANWFVWERSVSESGKAKRT